MDRHFLEFWGNFLINAAKGQKQLEDIAKWISQGFSGLEDLAAKFQEFYGLVRLNKDSPEYQKMWKKAEEDFRKSFRDYLGLFGVVPKEEHLALAKKCEELEEKIATQEETIGRLRTLLVEKAVDPIEMVKGFQDLIKKQSDQFQEFVKGFGQSFKKDSPSDDRD